MQRALILLVMVVIVVIAWIVMPSGSPPARRPTTRFTFLSFTNSAAGAPATNMWVGIMDIPKDDTIWSVISISHREGTNWTAWDPLPSPSFSWQYPKPDNFHLGATIPVPTTNAPVRVVIELRNQRKGKVLKFFEEKKIRWSWLKHWPAALGGGSRGSTFLITNEFHVAVGTNAAVK